MSENNTRRKNGLGSVRTLSNGKVMMKKQHGYLQNGKPRILTVTGSSESACIKLMKKKIDAIESEAENASTVKKWTLTELCMTHFEHDIEKKDKLKPKGADRRESTIRNQIALYDIGKLPVNTVTSRDVEDHIEYLIKNTPLSVSSIRKTLDVINSAYTWAIKHKYLKDNPCDPVLSDLKSRLRTLETRNSSEGVIHVLSADETVTLEKYIYSGIGKNDNLSRDILGLSVLILLYTGIRVGELCALRWKDFSEPDRTLSISKTRNTPKNRNGASTLYSPNENVVKNCHSRVLFLDEKALNTLTTLKDISPKTCPDDYIMLNSSLKPSTPTQVDHNINNLYKRAGLGSEISGAHILRRTCATKLFNEGYQVEKIAAYLGDSVATINKHYLSLTQKVVAGDTVLNVVALT